MISCKYDVAKSRHHGPGETASETTQNSKALIVNS